MAQLHSDFPFTGSLGNLSAYKMRGSGKVILRHKGGPSRKTIKTASSCDLTRRYNSEFGGRSAATSFILRMLRPQRFQADYNIAGPLNARLKPVQEMDTESELGRRNVVLSRYPRLLEGFSLSRRMPFDSVVGSHISCSLSRDTLAARVEISELLPGINFFVPNKHPMYSFVATLGIVPDVFYTANGYKPTAESYRNLGPEIAETDWHSVRRGSPAVTLELKLPAAPPDQSFSLILSIGICFGTMYDTTTVRQVKYAGSARVLAMA